MKKILAIALILTTVSIIPVSASVEHKVIRVIDGDTVYVDFNDNGIAEQDEKVRINGIDTFETKLNEGLNWQMKLYNLTQDEALGLGYYGKEFAKKELLNKPVRAEYTAEEKFDKNNRHLMSLYYDCNRQGKCKSYEQEVLKAGLATIYTKSNLADELKPYLNLDKIKANAKKSHKLNLVVLNKKNGKYHKTSCEYGWKSGQQELINKPLVKYAPASCCYPKEIKVKNPDFFSESIEIYFLDPTIANSNNSTSALVRLLSLIEAAHNRIYFAVYGVSNYSFIDNIVNRYSNGLDIKWVTDVNKYGKNNYSKTSVLQEKVPSFKTDDANDDLKFYNKQQIEFYIKNQKIKTEFEDEEIEYFTDQLMHNKFFIFDDSIVTTGSVNISNTGIGGKYVNANDFIVIKSKLVNEIYTKEFNQMYAGSFHRDKKYIADKKNITLEDGTVVSIYFSPKDYTFMNDVIKIIDKSEKYVYVPMFYLTDNKVTQSLIDAKERGVDVRVILDASSALSKYSKHKILRIAGVPVKVENWSGKMHMKCLITENYVVTGSLNWTKRAQNFNDENSLIVFNPKIAEVYKKNFMQLYNSIPNKWLFEDPKPEGKDSLHSCSDGLDNDHDGFTDMEDLDCNPNATQDGKPFGKYYENLE